MDDVQIFKFLVPPKGPTLGLLLVGMTLFYSLMVVLAWGICRGACRRFAKAKAKKKSLNVETMIPAPHENPGAEEKVDNPLHK